MNSSYQAHLISANINLKRGIIMSYTRDELLIEIKRSTTDMQSFYKQRFINYRGVTTDTSELYTEIIAKFLCDNFDVFATIPTIQRQSSYKTASHDGKYSLTSNREEEKIAMDIFCMSKYDNIIFDEIGTVLDYQIPLKNIRSDTVGKIDLLSSDGVTARVLELKTPSSTETMLRCVLEAFTYLKTLDTEKCKTDFDMDSKMKFEASSFVFIDSIQHKEFLDLSRTHLHKLVNMLNIVPFFIENVGEKEYKVSR